MDGSQPHSGGGFAQRLIGWQRQHGRHGLPWQATSDPYRVWLSEIMLQQTQVATVNAYYLRFLKRFPDLAALAEAPLDEVLALWAGLGYYSRARNLHRCAIAVRDQWAGRFPSTSAQLMGLPGIGRSTAAAIAAFCFGERISILDSNVRRVLARQLAFDGDLCGSKAVNRLWERANALLPASDMAAYTQALMDLGALVCTSKAPRCQACPVKDTCLALQQGAVSSYPVQSRQTKKTAQAWWLLCAQDGQGRVWLSRRPVPGIWAGLFCLPVHDSRPQLARALGKLAERLHWHPPRRHALTHKNLVLHLAQLRVPGHFHLEEGRFYTPAERQQLGLPAPVSRWLDELGG